MGKELELKYALTEEAYAALEAQFDLKNGERLEMRSTYYDTPDRTLAARKWTLRHRMEGEESVICMKTAPVDDIRGEWELPGEDPAAAIPALIALGAPAELEALAAQGLIPVCGARFLRKLRRLQLEDGVCELALDQGELRGGTRQQAFRELELELKEGEAAGLRQLGEDLAKELGLRPEPKPKSVRAMALAE